MFTVIHPLDRLDVVAVRAMLLELDQEPLRHALNFLPGLDDLQRQTVDDPDFEPDLCLGARAGDELLGCIMAVRRPWKQSCEGTGFVKWLLVRETARRRGIASELLDACETALRRRGVRTVLYGSSSPIYLYPGVPDEDTGLQAFLAARGWRRVSERISLVVQPTACRRAASVDAPEGVRLTLVRAGDRERLSAFVERQFSASWAAEMAPVYDGRNGAFCSVALDTQTQTFLGFAAVNAANPHWLGPMGVTAARRRRGLGRALVRQAVDIARKRSIASLMLPWVNANERFYENALGRLERRVFHKFEKKLR